MNSQKIILIIIVLTTTVLIICNTTEKTFARNGYNSGSSTSTIFHIQPNAHPPPMPPGFPYKWVGKDLIKRFNNSGLEIEKATPVAKTDSVSLPVKTQEIIRFSTPSFGEDAGGYILSFEKRDDLEKVKKYYLEMNKTGELYTWSFVKDNIILVLAGNIPEEKARQYETVLYDLREKK